MQTYRVFKSIDTETLNILIPYPHFLWQGFKGTWPLSPSLVFSALNKCVPPMLVSFCGFLMSHTHHKSEYKSGYIKALITFQNHTFKQ